jgi:hypothetical protein
MPDAGLPVFEEPSAASDPASRTTGESIASDASETAPPAARTTPRRSRLGALFAGLGLNWTRR